MEWYPELQRREQAGETLRQMQAWLLEAHGVKASASMVYRALERIRAQAPDPPPPPKPPLELAPQTEEDELKELRSFARDEMQLGDDWKQRHSAARLLLSVRAELRASREKAQAGKGTQPIAPAEPEPAVVFN